MNSKREAIVFGKYLLSGCVPDDKTIALYEAAVNVKNVTVPASEKKLFEFVLRHNWCIGAVDGALALSRPDHIIRRKLLIMTAILECRPQYADLFLTEKRTSFYFIVFCWTGFRAVCKALFGKLLVAFAS